MKRRRPLQSARRRLAAAALALAGAAHAQGQADAGGIVSVEVFANSAMHITPESPAGLPYQLKVYRLDALQGMEATLNQQLPRTEAQARAWLAANQARIRRQFQPIAVAAAEGMTRMMDYRLNRIPAIVINRQVAVYGVTDVNRAIELARQRAAKGRS
jgi:integrating conjugative element protein (TIGR03757 family)